MHSFNVFENGYSNKKIAKKERFLPIKDYLYNIV